MIQSDPLLVYLYFNSLIFNKLNFTSDPTDTHTLVDHLFAFVHHVTMLALSKVC
jgi:hypothetical protein